MTNMTTPLRFAAYAAFIFKSVHAVLGECDRCQLTTIQPCCRFDPSLIGYFNESHPFISGTDCVSAHYYRVTRFIGSIFYRCDQFRLELSPREFTPFFDYSMANSAPRCR